MLSDLSLRRRARHHLRRVDAILRRVHKTASLGNKHDPLDELMFVQMTVRTRNGFSAGVYNQLRKEVEGDWNKLLKMPVAQVRRILHPAGMSRVKTDRFRKILRCIRNELGRVTLRPLRNMDDEEAEDFLRKLPGVGPKVARCVLMYSLGRSVFPVDTNCRRVLRRLGYLPEGIHDKASHDFLQALVPPAIRYTLHVNLVHHGNTFCRASAPLCYECPLTRICPMGQKRLKR